MYLIFFPTISWSCKLEKSTTPLRFWRITISTGFWICPASLLFNVLKHFKISSHYSDALLLDPLFTFLMKKLIKRLSKFKYLKCFLSHHALKFWLIFIYIHSFGELFYLCAKAQDFTWGNGDVYFHVKFNENLFPGTVHKSSYIYIY